MRSAAYPSFSWKVRDASEAQIILRGSRFDKPAHAFVGEKKECLVMLDGPAYRPSKLMLAQGDLLIWLRVKPVPRIQGIVALKSVSCSVNLIRS